MDVQALDAGVAPQAAVDPIPQATTPSPPSTPPATPAQSGPAPGQASATAPVSGTPAPSLPQGVVSHASLLSSVSRTLAGATVNVSYRVDPLQHEVVTVFKDARTGQVLFQVPSQILEQLASFFDQQSGAMIDHTV